MVKIETILLIFQAYHKLVKRQIKMLKAFDMEGYMKLHPDRLQLSQEYQNTVSILLEMDLAKLKLSKEIKQKMQKMLRAIHDDLELQKKLLFHAQKTQERLADIHRNYAQKASVTTYSASGYKPRQRESMVALSEVS